MAPTHYDSEGTLNEASAMLEAVEALFENMAAHTEQMRQSLHDIQMHLAALSKELAEKLQHDRAVALEGSEYQLQKVMQDHLGHLSESAIEELFAPNKISGNLAVGEGQVDEEIRAKFVEILEKWSAEAQAFESLFQQGDYTTFLHDVNDTNIFANANANGNTAPDSDWRMPFPLPVGSNVHGVNYTKPFPLGDDDNTHKKVIECRSRAVAACFRQTDCFFGDGPGSLAGELAKCDTLADASTFKTIFLASTLAVLVVIAFMICSAFRLASERQVRAFGLGLVAVCLVVRFGGM